MTIRYVYTHNNVRNYVFTTNYMSILIMMLTAIPDDKQLK